MGFISHAKIVLEIFSILNSHLVIFDLIVIYTVFTGALPPPHFFPFKFQLVPQKSCVRKFHQKVSEFTLAADTFSINVNFRGAPIK